MRLWVAAILSAAVSIPSRQFFLQNGTGAVQRGLASKLADVISVKDFGALGDNSTDDTVAIQAADAALCAAGGGTLYFPAGTYKTTSYIGRGQSACSNLSYIGAGIGVTIISNSGTFPNNTAFNVQGTLGSNFAINAPTEGAATVTTTTAGDAGNFTAGDNVAVSGAINSGDYPGFFLSTVVSAVAGTGVITLFDNLPRSDLTLVHKITSLPRNVSISNLSVAQASDVGWIFKYTRDIAIRNVVVDNGGAACGEIIGTRDAWMEDSTCANSLSIGSLTVNGSYGVHVVGNHFRGVMASTAIGFENSSESGEVRGNIVMDPGGTAIRLGGGPGAGTQRITVVGNIIKNLAASQSGINLGGPGNNNIAVGNIITCKSASGTLAINANGTDVVVSGNAVGLGCLTALNIGGGTNTVTFAGNSFTSGNVFSNSATNALSQGSGTLTSGTPSTATAPVPRNCRCRVQNTTTAANALKCSVSGTTLTVTGPNTITDAFNFGCDN